MSKLAIRGGKKLRDNLFPGYIVMGEEEAQAAYDVVKSGVLSKFLGCWDPDFFGGPQIQAFENECKEYFGVKHAITVNSNSSGLICALGALGIGPGDEVIVSPFSMTISASSPLFYGAVPVFADIEEDYFCLSAAAVEKKITSRTKAILAVDFFGQPYDVDGLNALSKKYNIPIIEDNAQGPLATFKNKYAGTLGTIGVFSLNYHKHIHTGEGGIIVTNDDDLATRCQLIRNHAEAVVDPMGYKGSPVNLIGFNFRMTEVEAAIGRCQLKKLKDLVLIRRENVQFLEQQLKGIDYLIMPKVRENCTHSYYGHAIRFKEEIALINRKTFVDAVIAELPATELRETEGVLMGVGGVKPLYLQSLYQNRTGIGRLGYPFNDPNNKSEMNYQKGICPVVEKLHFQELFIHELMRPGMSKQDLTDVANAFHKVAENINDLRE
ncbi:MAG: DegT/DnrJ/EryC1/StrS family aminotransferase [Bacteriovorax sp.]|nr:DegT/DnrJ/EryC1/StrS family aminotransferase [Bacteriovorax sp.]